MKSAMFTESSKKKDKVDESIPAICQVVEMAEKLGYIEPTDLSVPRDIVDLTLMNVNGYTKKLVLNETNLGSLIEGAIAKMQQSEEQEENGLDDLPDVYDMIEQGMGEPGEVEMINFANFNDYGERYEQMVENDLLVSSFNGPSSTSLDDYIDDDDEEGEDKNGKK